MLLEVVSQKNRTELIEYVKRTYSNVIIYVQEQWVRLDFNQDGKVDFEDVRLSLQKFYEFLRNYDYIQASQKISSAVYEEAQKYLKSGARANVDNGDIPITEEVIVADNSGKKEE